jgi:hypothetical protein
LPLGSQGPQQDQGLFMAFVTRLTEYNRQFAKKRVGRAIKTTLYAQLIEQRRRYTCSIIVTSLVICYHVLGGQIQGFRTLKEVWMYTRTTNRHRVWASAMWEIWKERDARIFRGESRQACGVQHLIHENVNKWRLAYDN